MMARTTITNQHVHVEPYTTTTITHGTHVKQLERSWIKPCQPSSIDYLWLTMINPWFFSLDQFDQFVPHMKFSWNRGNPKSSILVGFSLINYPAMGVPPFMETPAFALRKFDPPGVSAGGAPGMAALSQGGAQRRIGDHSLDSSADRLPRMMRIFFLLNMTRMAL